MSVVGEFPFGRPNRAIRTPPNPMDKTTIVSIYPLPIDELKPTLQPNRFVMEKGSMENPSVLLIGPSSWWKEDILGETDPTEIPVGSINVADSIVRDFCIGTLEVAYGQQQPGLFYLPGEWDAALIKKEKKAMLMHYHLLQNRWFEALIKLGDSMWARSQGNPLAIDDRMRLAAQLLQKDKPWIKDFQSIELVSCTACGHLRNPKFPVCGACNRVIDQKLAKELGIAV